MEARHTSGEYSVSLAAPQSIASSCASGHTWALTAHHGRQKDDPHAAQVPAEGSCLSHGGVLVLGPAAVATMLVNMLELQCKLAGGYSYPDTSRAKSTSYSAVCADDIRHVSNYYMHLCDCMHAFLLILDGIARPCA